MGTPIIRPTRGITPTFAAVLKKLQTTKGEFTVEEVMNESRTPMPRIRAAFQKLRACGALLSTERKWGSQYYKLGDEAALDAQVEKYHQDQEKMKIVSNSKGVLLRRTEDERVSRW